MAVAATAPSTFWKKHLGVTIALGIILAWGACLYLLLTAYTISWTSPLTWLLVLVQTHLYTGLFITAHDAMHGVVSSHKKLNTAIGWLAALLFAYNWYPRLFPRHHQHHRHVATEEDPDYHPSGNFFRWYLSFLGNYITIWQLVAMAITYNLLILVFPQPNVILYWMVPSILATCQLFYFGTYLPHMGEHAPDNRHKSGSQPKNHLWAFISCYFFGYHWEHHNYPGTPWWQLWKKKA
ncbi:fatty acid desaturase [Cesiribacter andamanensis]|uniref:Fatty acid desaturase n=1 Tax=Cesiribacter andamanensis AMV16 TaxID=1279009 RepID=M7N3D6_9BACT|nr:fatty acid desaturase [Cesiribacter andamanensis]EMR01782.1 Fatty acid desaturase [Cesiribacter andamanensis AMV16]